MNNHLLVHIMEVVQLLGGAGKPVLFFVVVRKQQQAHTHQTNQPGTRLRR
jgi:hypothetical protein